MVEADGEIIAMWGGNAVIVDSLTQPLHHRVEVTDILDSHQPADPPASACMRQACP